jgi:hypothetical protein
MFARYQKAFAQAEEYDDQVNSERVSNVWASMQQQQQQQQQQQHHQPDQQQQQNKHQHHQHSQEEAHTEHRRQRSSQCHHNQQTSAHTHAQDDTYGGPFEYSQGTAGAHTTEGGADYESRNTVTTRKLFGYKEEEVQSVRVEKETGTN